LEAIAAMLQLTVADVVLDCGCGEGYFLGNLTALSGCQATGIDLSSTAIELAARRYPDCFWIVGNADRELPFADNSISAIVSITGRRNPPEFARLLAPGGRVLIAVPGERDLLELRGKSKPRGPVIQAEMSGLFQLVQQSEVEYQMDLPAHALSDLRTAIYRPRPTDSAGDNIRRVTFHLDFFLWQPLP
jgi:23S rRNA (guanine745-N1)-methyltransferase